MVSRKIGAITASAGLAAFGGWILIAQARPAPEDSGRTLLDAHRTLGAPGVFRNLAVFPVYDASAKDSDTYVTLDEGLKARLVQVKESGDGGSVNTLYVTNSGKKPLYLMAGEVVLGGQQDRTLARDTIVPAGKRGVPITVFCVEHGRWSGRSEFGQSAPAVASLSIRASAMNGEFNATKNRIAARSSGQLAETAGRRREQRNIPIRENNEALRLQPAQRAYAGDEVSKAQQQVWDGVEAKNRKFKIQNQTGTYRDALTLKGGDTQKSVPAYEKSLSHSLGSGSHLAGVVAAVNGKVIAADIFSDPVLFRKLWPKLLRSYAADAVEQAQPGESARAGNAITARDVKTFMAAAKNGKSKEVNVSADGRTLRYESAGASVYGLVPAGKSAGSAATPLHESVLKK